MKLLLKRCLEMLKTNTDCANPKCTCEGNEATKKLASDLLKAINKKTSRKV